MSDQTANQTTARDESELVRLCQGISGLATRPGDRQSFRLLYRRYYPKVRSTLYQLCGKSLLDDLTQEVFLRAWRGLGRLDDPEHFGTWLYRITWNVALDQRRRFAKQQAHHQKQVQAMANESDRPEPLTQMHYQNLVQQGLHSLSLEHRAVLVLHDLEDLPQKDVAAILRLRPGTVKSRLHYARRALRQFFAAQGVSL